MVTKVRTKPKRFSVSLSKEDYKRLTAIAKSHRPTFSLQYLVNWSIQKGLLERTDDRKLYDDLGNPLGGKSSDG